MSDRFPPSEAAAHAPLDMDSIRVDPGLALRVPPNLALRRQMLPVAESGGVVLIACANPSDHAGVRGIERYLEGFASRPVAAEPESLRRVLQNVYGGLARKRPGAPDADEGAVEVADELMRAAILRGASDIHIDPEEESARVRFRVDGALEDYRDFPKAAHGTLVSRLKVLANLDIAEKRAPQDGSFRHARPGSERPLDVRVATLPTKHGERVTLRLLALKTESLTLERLGMSPAHLEAFSAAIRKPHGLVLLAGPTGSGKTTTLYAAIRALLEDRALNVVTIEDPIEYDIPGVAQVEVDASDRVSFFKALRSVLRHDPDVIMIGEIRDAETADVAIKSALTGHLVFSTLHTNSAAGVITRLLDMGVPRYLIAATLRLAVAQRLARRLCDRCAKSAGLSAARAAALQRPKAVGQPIREPVGCLYCANRGVSDRLALFELLAVDEEWSRRIAAGMDENQAAERMRELGVPFLVDDAADKMLAGRASFQDIMNAVTVW